jgi:hypothetical protein
MKKLSFGKVQTPIEIYAELVDKDCPLKTRLYEKNGSLSGFISEEKGSSVKHLFH